MDKRIKISSLWMWLIVFFLCLMGIVILQSWIMRQVPVSVTPAASSPESISKGTESKGEVGKGNNPIVTMNKAPQTVNSRTMIPGTLTTDNKPMAGEKVPASSKQSLQNQAIGQESQSLAAPTINAPMTDAQIQESIQQQNQRQQAAQQIIAKRDEVAIQVMRNAEAVQSNSANNQQVIPSDSPRATPPADIVAKLKAHQLTAH